MRTSRRAAASLLLAAVAIVATACAPASGGGSPGGGTPSACDPKGPGEIHVAVVADFTAFSGPTNVVCVTLPAGSNGVDALFERADELGATDPRFDVSGLMCAIDDLPLPPDCGASGPNGFEYWSYWVGGTDWSFAPVGPASRTLSDGDVEGWRFLPGGQSNPPSASSDFASLTG